MRKRSLSVLVFLWLAAGPSGVAVDTPITRSDDAYHFASFEDGQHDASYAEWWYFNLADPEQDVEFAFAYAVLDPANHSGLGLASVLAMVYRPAGRFQQGAYLPSEPFSASHEQAHVASAGWRAAGGRL